MPHRFKDYPPSTNSGHGRAWSLGEGSHQGPDATSLMGLDSIAFWSDAVSEPPTGEHWTSLSVQL
jgi:hypothetical protein